VVLHNGSSGACTVYEHRPVACRTHLSLNDDDLLCRAIPGVSPEAEAAVPRADTRAVWLLHLAAHAGDVLADIRDFFPTGVSS
jgi:hypothetical protein